MSQNAIIYYAADRLVIRELIEAYAHCADRQGANVALHRRYPLRGVAVSRVSFSKALAPGFAELNTYDTITHFVDLGSFCAGHAAPGGVGGNLCGCDRRRHSRRRSERQRPGRRLGPHGRLAAGVQCRRRRA
jgi:hypothetical protein